MTDAGDISEQIGERVVARHDWRQYWVPGLDDVSDLPSVGGFDPIPDPTAEE